MLYTKHLAYISPIENFFDFTLKLKLQLLGKIGFIFKCILSYVEMQHKSYNLIILFINMCIKYQHIIAKKPRIYYFYYYAPEIMH